MATITSAGSGLASATSTWVGGVVPVEGDKVIIAAGHVVEIDGTFTWGDDSVTTTIPNAAINVSGTLKASRSVSSSLTCKGLLLCNYNGAIDYGTDGDPIPAGVTADLILNKATTPAVREGLRQVQPNASGQTINWSFVGSSAKLRAVTLASTAAAAQNQIVLTSSAHGWAANDEVLLMPTTNNASVDEDEVKIVQSVSGATITFTTNLSYAHLAGSPACLLTNNVTIKPHSSTSGQQATIIAHFPSGLTTSSTLSYVLKRTTLLNVGNPSASIGMFSCNNYPDGRNASVTIDSVVFRATSTFYPFAFLGNSMSRECVVTNSVFCNIGQFAFGTSKYSASDSYFAINGSVTSQAAAGLSHYRNWYSLKNVNEAIFGNQNKHYNCTVSGRATALASSTFPEFYDCDLGYTYGWKPLFSGQITRMVGNNYNVNEIIVSNCKLNSTFSTPDTAANIQAQSAGWMTTYINKGQDVTAQEIYYGSGNVKRDNSTVYRSTSSVSIKPLVTGIAVTRETLIALPNGSTARVVGYVRRDNAAVTATVSLTGTINGVTLTPPTPFSSSATDTWQLCDLSITNSSGADGSVALTFSANSSNTTSTAYFDGMPSAPFVTKCRHYGFLFNETSPTVTVDQYVVLSEAAASALTGCTINGGTKHITFGAGTIDTASELYDYSRYWSVTNLTLDVPFSRAGSLYSLASGWTVVDPSISGITWGGGTIDWTATGTKNGGFDSNVFDFQAAGTYEFGNATLSGTIEFINTSGGAVIVNVPSGATYTNTGPNITVNVAVDQAEALISGIVAGSRLQIYNVTTATEMVNAINATTSYSLGYPNGTGYSTGDVVRVRLTYCNGLTAKLPVEYVTIASASGWSILANQQDDEVYIANGIDGSTVTEYSSDYVNVQIDISDPDNQTTIQRGYAWYCDQMTGDDGIRYFYGAFVAEDAFNYLLNTDVADIKIQNTGTAGVTLTGGSVRRKDGSSPIAAGGSVYIYYGRTYGLETGVSGLTATESSKLLSLNTDAVNVASMNGAEVIGDGSVSDPWRGVGVSP